VTAAAPADVPAPELETAGAAAPVLPETSEPAAPEETAVAAAPEVPAAPAQVAILRSGPEGVDVVQAPGRTPEAPPSVALDAISYSALGDVQLSGRAETGASEVRIYLDNRPVAALPVATGGDWRGDVPDIDAGVYTLRIDAVDAAGAVQSRVETPFKREAPEVLEAAAAQSNLPVQAITVQRGATLWAIARERYGDPLLYVQVFEANRDQIRDPDLIYPGQVFTLPESGE
jgi:nucleoid-associated protein YgaU